ncbi:hypothetical protein AB1Y20_000743 [Prymnesium parvum]|uniref:Uncharacterized protein n=1 Tax=Prymnesium parvum TaxID=97485 RepID=A0AB34K9Z3_PRYPA
MAQGGLCFQCTLLLTALRIMCYKVFVGWRRPSPIQWLTFRVVCVGLDGAGKSSLLFSAADHTRSASLPSVSPTNGFKVRSVNVPPDCRLEVWDLGGAESIRPFWTHYLRSNTDALIWVVDCADGRRIAQSCQLLIQLLESHVTLHGIPLLVILSKDDIAPAATVKHAEQVFEKAVTKQVGRSCRVHSCSVMRQDGIDEALQWLAGQLSR